MNKIDLGLKPDEAMLMLERAAKMPEILLDDAGQIYLSGFVGLPLLADRLGVEPRVDNDRKAYPLLSLLHAFLDKLEAHDG